MMDVWCDGCSARVLRWPGDRKGIVNTDKGLIVVYRCGEGHDGAEVVERAHVATA
jgi:hypothetical protein